MILFGEEHKPLTFSQCSFPRHHITSLVAPNVLLNTFSDILNLCSSRNVTHQVPHPYKTTCNIIMLYYT